VRRPPNISQTTIVELLLSPSISIVSFCLETSYNNVLCILRPPSQSFVDASSSTGRDRTTTPSLDTTYPTTTVVREHLLCSMPELVRAQPQPPRASETQVSQQLEAPLLSGADLTRRSSVQTPHTAHDPRFSLQGSARFRRYLLLVLPKCPLFLSSTRGTQRQLQIYRTNPNLPT
jgi:hypothetical protein